MSMQPGNLYDSELWISQEYVGIVNQVEYLEPSLALPNHF